MNINAPIEETYLVADIGGTSTRFALLCYGHEKVQKIYATKRFDSLFDAVKTFMQEPACESAKPEAAAFGLPGPVVSNIPHVTSIDWSFDVKGILTDFGIKRIHLMNDFEATARSLSELQHGDLHILRSSIATIDAEATKLVIGPGTGLGVAGIKTVQGIDVVLPTEAAHLPFAPVTTWQQDLMQKIRLQLPYKAKESIAVKTHEILSGPGLVNIYRALTDVAPNTVTPENVVTRARAGEIKAREALDNFALILGGYAANMTMALGAVGGVYLAGGVLQKMATEFSHDKFMEGFTDNSVNPNRAEYIGAVPVSQIKAENPAFTGLRRYLRQHTTASL